MLLIAEQCIIGYVIGEIKASYIDIVPVLFKIEPKIMLTDLYDNLSRYYKNK